jgi:tetratricopeptide (TPR) repeat protein
MKKEFFLFTILISLYWMLTGCMSQNFYANTPQGYRDLAQIYAQQGNIDNGVKLLINAIREYDSNDKERAGETTYYLAKFYSEYSDDPTLALQTYEDVFFKYPESSFAPQALFEAAQIAETKFRDYSKAKQDYKYILDSYPSAKIRDKAYLEYHRLIRMGF